MKCVFITPLKDCLLAELTEKSSDNLNDLIRRILWLRWKKMKDVNGKNCQRLYIVVDTTEEKEKRLSQFARLICEVEGYTPSPRICPHDLYYEDYCDYFECYKQ